MKGYIHTTPDGSKYIMYRCRCASEYHDIPISGENPIPWGFQGDENNFSLSPSILQKGGVSEKTICHHFVKNGQIQYLGDCPHEFKNQTLPLQDLSEQRKLNYDWLGYFRRMLGEISWE